MSSRATAVQRCAAFLVLAISCTSACGQQPQGPAGTVLIGAVQGTGPASPYAGQTVNVQGVVTGDYQDNDSDLDNNLGGFYLQDEYPDDDPRSSDAIFVFDGRQPDTDVRVGDRVIVRGKIQEHFGETQLILARIEKAGTAAAKAAVIRLPAADVVSLDDGKLVADLESFEGMLVTLPQTLTVSDLFALERFGEVGLSADGRLYQFTNIASPDADGYHDYQRLVASRSITLDDGRREQNIAPIRYLAGAGEALRTGDTVRNLTGNLRYSRGSGGSGRETWRLMPAQAPQFVARNPRPEVPPKKGALRIASFNVLNFFSRIDRGRNECGPNDAAPCRGADSPSELARQRDKIVTALTLLDADVVGLIELENDASASLALLVDALNARLQARVYAYVATGTIGNDAIKTGFIYKPATVETTGPFAVLTRGVDPDFDDGRNRPPLAQSFRTLEAGATLTVVVNHFKSKGSDCDDAGDPNRNDGQANCNLTRTRAALALAEWLAIDPTGSNDTDFLLLGDFNAYLEEDPIRALSAAGLQNLLHTDDAIPYSYVYDGQAGALDHAFASAGLAERIAAATVWHINADEAPVHDYNLEHGRDPAIFDVDNPYRSSDHDPVIVDLTLQQDSN